MKNKKILAVDFGGKNIGLAVTDEVSGVVFGKGVIRGRKSLRDVFMALKRVVEDCDVGTVVFGLPAAKDGGETAQSERMRGIGEKLESYLKDEGFSIKVVFWDESFSSFEAGVFMRGAGGKAYAAKYSEHEVAAMLILEKYLKSRGEGKAE